MAETFSCALILLAAGASVRMGRPKQLLPINGKPLLRYVAESALAAPVAPVVVVLGANSGAIAPCLDGLPVSVVINPAWAEGLAASLRAGLEAVVETTPAVDGVIVVLADQPDFAADHLAKLIDMQQRTGQPIVASESGGAWGPPVLFTPKFFPALRALRGDAGARSLLREHAPEVAAVPLATQRDLDTPADYADYLSNTPP